MNTPHFLLLCALIPPFFPLSPFVGGKSPTIMPKQYLVQDLLPCVDDQNWQTGLTGCNSPWARWAGPNSELL